jgi:hypothetical protein
LAAWQTDTSAHAIVQGRWDGPESRPLTFGDYAFWDNESPAVAAGNVGYLTVYEGDAQGDPTVHRHIYGRIYIPYAAFLPVIVR